MNLIGRNAEIARIRDTLATGTGRATSLLVLGDAGSGRTSVLDRAAREARAGGARVLTGQGVAAETGQPYAAAHQLLLPLLPGRDRLDGLDGLEDHHRRAVREAFGLAAATGPVDAFVLGVAVLELVGRAARSGPLAIVTDDLHHYDPASQELLRFVHRRLGPEPVCLIGSALEQRLPNPLDLIAPAVWLGPLDDQAAAQLLSTQPVPPTGRARAEILHRSQGNPLALVEFARAAAAGEPGPPHRPGRALDSGLGLSPRIREAFEERLHPLPAATRRLLLLLAAGTGPASVRGIADAAGRADILDGWTPAEDQLLVTIFGDSVVFTHPLMAAAIYHGAPAAERHRAHADLARAPAQSPAARAWHLSRAVTGPDEPAAAALERAADQAQAAGDWFEAATALHRSAECSPQSGNSGRRYVRAIQAASQAGDLPWVDELREQVSRTVTDPVLLTAADVAVAHTLGRAGRPGAALELVASALAREGTDRPTALMLLWIAASAAFESGRPEHRRILADLRSRSPESDRVRPGPDGRPLPGGGAISPVPPIAPAPSGPPLPTLLSSPVPEFCDAVLFPGVRPPESPVGEQAHPGGSGHGDPLHRMMEGGTLWLRDETGTALERLQSGAASLRRLRPVAAVTVSVAVVTALVDAGRWTEARQVLQEGRALAAISSADRLVAQLGALQGWLLALEGNPESASAVLESAWTTVDLSQNSATQALLLRAAAETAKAAHDLPTALRHLRSLFLADGRPLHAFHSPRAVSELASVAHRLGCPQELDAVLAGLRAQPAPERTIRMSLVLHHAEALTGSAGPAGSGASAGSATEADIEKHFRLAVVNPEAERWPLERARARLHYAEWLRRRRRQREARPLLDAALETFTRLGAGALITQAQNEVRASGRSRATPVRASGRLTPQEEEIVRLAAQGLRNREIAEQLFLSPRTVGAHLYRAFPKLGISDRHQLRDVLESSSGDS